MDKDWAHPSPEVSPMAASKKSSKKYVANYSEVHRTFHYNASAHAFSGHFTRPVQHLIEVQAPTALPTIGGVGSSRVENFKFKEYVKFDAGYTHVAGSEQREIVKGGKGGIEEKVIYTTLVTATIENLNILDVVTADRIVSRISSYYVDGAPESHFSFLGSKFENLHIGGCKADITLNHDFFAKYKTFAAIKNELKNEKNEEFRTMAGDPFETGTPIQLAAGHEVILCSLVKKMKTDAPDVTTRAHAFVLPHFGRVYLAEAIIDECKRTLTMLRLELGSPIAASGVFAQSVGNGRPWPG